MHQTPRRQLYATLKHPVRDLSLLKQRIISDITDNQNHNRNQGKYYSWIWIFLTTRFLMIKTRVWWRDEMIGPKRHLLIKPDTRQHPRASSIQNAGGRPKKSSGSKSVKRMVMMSEQEGYLDLFNSVLIWFLIINFSSLASLRHNCSALCSLCYCQAQVQVQVRWR